VWANSHMPLLFIRSPGQDAEFTAGQPIPVQVEVDFDYLPIPLTLYADGQELTTFSAPPYELIWSNATTGSHRLTAVAYSRYAALPVTIHIVPEVTQVQANAGPDQLIVLPNAATLTGAVKIPSQPVNTTTNVLWTGISGPGTVHFSSATALTTTAQFDDPGLYVLQMGVTTDSGTASDTVQVEVLPTAHNGMTAVRSNEGKDFWLTFLSNYGAANLSLVVASRQDGTGEVEFFDFDYHARRTMLFEVKANTTTVVPLKIASDPQYATSGAKVTNAIHVTVSTAVSIYGLSSANGTADGFLALPKVMLGTNYIVFAYGNTRNPNYQLALGTQFAIVGTEDNTKVKIIPSVTTGAKAAGVQYEIALQKGETYRLINTTTELGDLTGTSIVSDRPVAVFGGHQAAYVPDRTLFADHLVEQIPPVSTWGRQFVTLPLARRSHGDTFRILSSEDHTSVSINGDVVAVLNRGQFIERLIEEASSIVGNQPILVAQFANGLEFDGSVGDPFMTLVPAVDQYGGSYILSTPLSYETWFDQYIDPFWFGSYANLIVPTAAASTLILDGSPATNLQFTAIGSSGFVGVQIPVPSGVHAYSAQAPFGITLYGWGYCTSYAFLGGLYSDTIELGTHLTFEQPTRFSPVNTEKVVVAKPLDARGNPVPDLQITFQVTGANPASGQLLSDQFGEAVFAYHGTNEGIDIITASVLDNAQRLTNTWLAASVNQPPVVQAGSDQVIQIGQSAQLHANIVDDGQPANTLVASWRSVSGPVPARFLDAHAAATTVQFDFPGSYVLELSANDTVFAARDRLTVTVTTTNIPPTLVFDESSYDGQTWFKGDRLYFQGSAYDLDGKVVRVELYDGDTRIAETPLDTWGEFEFEWEVPRRGLIHLRLSAVDNTGAATSKSFTIVGKEIHVALTQPAPSALVGSEKWVSASITDDAGLPMPGQWIGFSVSGANYLARYVFAGDLSEATFAYASTTPGTDIITATVYGYYCKDTVTNLWLLTSTNLPPVVNAGTYPNVYATRALALNGSASDDGYPSGRLTYSWRVLSGPGDGFGVVFSDANALATTVTFPQVGDYQFELAASDSMFGTRSLTTVHVSVFVGSPPAVTWLTPTTGQSLAVGQSTTLTVQPSDPDGVVTHVAYYFQEGTNWAFLGHGAGPQFTLTWTPQTAATAVLLARATDNDGLSSADYTNWVTVVEPSTPDVVLVSPSSNATLYVSVPVYLEAYGTITPPAQITRVEYFVNAASVGMATNEPFWLPWTPPAIGAYQITAMAYADVGTTATSPAIDVTVALPQPQVSLVSPANGQFLNLAEPTLLFARLTDLAGAVTNLEFFVDGAPYLNSAIWYVAWTPAALGQHTLQVFANDRFGQRVGSAPITVTVAVLHPPTVALITPTNGATFAFGSVASWQAQASDSDGAVTNLVLEWDGQPLAQTNGVVLEMGWTNASAGWHWLVARATDDTAQTASTSVRYFVLRPENPELVAPSSLSAESVSSTEIKLTWPRAPTQGLPKLVIVERWDPVPSAWVETGSTEAAQIEYASAGLNPETTYRYRVVVVDANGARSGYSPEAQATTRTAVPTYSVIDITKSLTTSLLNQQPVSTLLTNVGLNNFDQRRNVGDWTNRAEAALGTNAVALKLAVARFKERWPQIQLDFDPVLVTPKSILPRTGFLTGAGGSGVTVSEATAQLFDPNDPYRPIKAFLQEHRALFGFGPEALGEATVPRDYAAGAAAIRTVVCQQQVAGVPVFGALLIGHLTPSNELAALSSQFVPFPSQAADPAMLGLLQSGGELPWPAPYALVAAVTNVGEVFGLGDLLVKSNAQGQVRKQVFSASAGIKGDAYAELAWFPSSRTQLRLCWQVLFTSPWRNEMYLALVAADTGEVLLRRSLTTTSSDATYRVFTGRSPAPMSPGWPAPNSAQPPLTERSLITLAALNADASPQGWIADGVNETRGNNVNAYLDRNDDDYPDPPQITGNPWRVFDFPLDLNGSPDAYRQAAAVQLFYWNNWMHDALYSFGFTEAAGNFQFDNFGRGGFAGDEVWAEAQDGSDLNDRSHRNNANMSTPPDGFSARMQMYRFDGSNPGRDGSLDAEIILHEYTHGLSGRLVGGGAGIDALATAGLGEGWSDFYALALLSQAGEDPDGAYPMGAYVTYQGFGTGFEENYYYGIRRYPYCTDTNNNPLTFKDIDPWQASPHTGVPRNPILGPFQPEMAGEVHHQGEVWGTLLWEVRASLVKKHGFPQGNNLALQLMTDGMRLCPPNPNWVQARDAILLADRILTDAANEAELWTAFAKRGLGYSAKAPESYGTSGVQEGYDLIRALAVERVEVLGGNGNGSVEPAEDNDLVIHLANHGSGVATQVIAKLSTGTPGVIVLQALSAYADMAQGQARTNTTSFQIRTDSGFVNGTAIDLVLVISSASTTITNGLRLYGGVPGTAVLLDTYSALGGPPANTTEPRYLTPLDLDNMEPLWMSENVRCLLKSPAGPGRYLLWRPDGDPIPMVKTNFTAHRLTRDGVVVGRLELDKTPVVLVREDVYTNQLNQVQTHRVCFTNWYPHTIGVKWVPGEDKPVPLTSTNTSRTNYLYQFPKASLIYTNVGMAYLLANNSPTNNLGFTFEFPTLNDVWDLAPNGVAVGGASVYVQPLDDNSDGQIDRNELEFSICEQHRYGSAGLLNWLEVTERDFIAGYGINVEVAVNDNTLLTTAVQFNADQSWRWVGPVSFRMDGSPTSIGLLAGGHNSVVGCGAVFTGNPAVDAYSPTHAFRFDGHNEFGAGVANLTYEATPVTEDLGTLPGGLYSFPRAVSPSGEIVGYSSYDQLQGGGNVSANPYLFHGVYWAGSTNRPEDLGSLGPMPALGLPRGFSDAYAINSHTNIAGTALRNYYTVLRTNYVVQPINEGWQTNIQLLRLEVSRLQKNDNVLATNGASAAVLWQINHNTNGQPFWEIADLNGFVTDTNADLMTAVGINDDEVVLARKRLLRTASGQGDKNTISALLLRFETVSRDRFLAGSFRIPHGFESVELEFVNSSTAENLGRYSDLLGGGATRVFDAVTDLLQDESATQSENQRVWFVKNPDHPRQIDFYTCFNGVGAVEIRLYLKGHYVGPVKHTLERAEDFAFIIDYVNDWVEGVGFNVDESAPPPMMGFSALPGASGTRWINNLSIPCLIPFFNVISPASGFTQVQNTAALAIGLFDGVKNGVNDDYQFVKLLIGGSVTATGWMAQQEYTELQKWRNPRQRAIELKAMQDRICEELVFRPLAGVAQDLTTWDGFKKRAWQGWDGIKRGGSAVWALDLQIKIALAQGVVEWANDWVDRMVVAAEKASWDAAPWNGNAFLDEFMTVTRQSHYTAGYTFGYVSEQVFLLGGLTKVANVMVKGGVQLAGTLTARTGFTVAARCHLLKQYLTSVALSIEMRVAIERGLVEAAKRPLTSVERRTAAEIIESRLANPAFNRSAFTLKELGDAAVKGQNIPRLFLIAGEEWRYFENVADFIKTMENDATADAVKGWTLASDGVFGIDDSGRLFAEQLQADRGKSLLDWFNARTSPQGRQTLSKTMEKFAQEGGYQGGKFEIPLDPSVKDLYSIMYHHADESTFEFMKLAGESDGKAMLTMEDRIGKGYHYVSPETANTRDQVAKMFELPDKSVFGEPDTTGRYRLVFKTEQATSDIKIPQGRNHTAPTGQEPKGIVSALEPMCVDNPVLGSTSGPKGRQAVTQQSLTGYVEDLEQGGRVLTREELELLIRKAGGQP